MAPTPHDALFKQVFGRPQHAEGLLRTALPQALAERIDWSSLQPRPESFVDDALGQHHADLLFDVALAGRAARLYLLLEHKSDAGALTAFQLARYVVRILELHLRQHPNAQRLPAVIPIVVHHNRRGFRAARRLSALFDLPTDLRDALGERLLQLRVVVDDIGIAVDDALTTRAQTSATARLALLFLARARHAAALRAALRAGASLCAGVVRESGGPQQLVTLFWYLVQASQLDSRELAHFLHPHAGPTMTDDFVSTADRLRLEGQKLGLAEGQKLGATRMLLGLLQDRFGDLPTDVEARIDRAPVERILAWGVRVVHASSLEAVFADHG